MVSPDFPHPHTVSLACRPAPSSPAPSSPLLRPASSPLLRLFPPPVFCCQLHHRTGSFSTVEGPFLPIPSLHELFASFLTLTTALSNLFACFSVAPIKLCEFMRMGPSLSCISRIYTAPGYCNLRNYRMNEKKNNQQLNFECRINE